MWHLIVSSQANIDILKRMEKYLISKIKKTDITYNKNRCSLLLLDTENKSKTVAEAFAAVFLSYYKRNFFETNCDFPFLSDRLNYSLKTALCYFDNEYEFKKITENFDAEEILNIDGYINFKLREFILAWKENINVIEDSVYAGISRDKIIDLIVFLIESRRVHRGKIIILEELNEIAVLTGDYKLIKKISPFNEKELLDILVKLMPKEIVIGKLSCDKGYIDFLEEIFNGKITVNASSNKILNFNEICLTNINY